MNDGWRQILGRAFGQGESPLHWGVTFAKIGGVRLRAHLLLVLWLAAQPIRALSPHYLGLSYVLPIVAWLLVLLIARELARAWVCRRIGGRVEEVVLWPFGSVAGLEPPDRWPAVVRVAVTGLLFQLGVGFAVAGAYFVAGGPASGLVFNPLQIDIEVFLFAANEGPLPMVVQWLWWGHVVNTALLLANLLPMAPFDASSGVWGALWSRLGREEARSVAANIGFATAFVVLAVAYLRDVELFYLFAIVGGLMTWYERRTASAVVDLADPELDTGPSPREVVRLEGPAAARRREAESAAELDLILDKISREGIDSLSKKERARLDAETARQRSEQTGERPRR
ncbi:MAG: DUF6576 domain-containing protein [Planctomycetota bacterium]